MKLTDDQEDALKEVFNIGIGRAASLLNEMVGAPVTLRIPVIRLSTVRNFIAEKESQGIDTLSMVSLRFGGNFSGLVSLNFPPESSVILVSLLTGEKPGSPNLDSMRASTLSEVGNIILNAIMGSLGNILEESIEYRVPFYSEKKLLSLHEEAALVDERYDKERGTLLIIESRIEIQDLDLGGEIIILFQIGSLSSLLKSLEAH